ncbi:hypothetical protein BKA67DRAFT_24619 [Truncatella angustata]|uniref:AAA+ ATPase domain-containing protein n=1 Tax=Truncatella angustata TaxID=152316 RepID=A0A9P8UXD3_9PEZI|nr:uncharacterized protein BKA67DRAFT_24619 [Truncatella angustata]KAH6659684.1 hypothetical protein BKA67DRAFT_24619 [Truncatella angustata]
MARQKQDLDKQQQQQQPKEGTAWPSAPHEMKKRQLGAGEPTASTEPEFVELIQQSGRLELPTEQVMKRPRYERTPEPSTYLPTQLLSQPLLPLNTLPSEPSNSVEVDSKKTRRDFDTQEALSKTSIPPLTQWPSWWEAHSQVVHQVICSSSFHAQEGKLFSTAPSWAAESQTGIESEFHHCPEVHLTSSIRIANLAAFVKQSGNTSFIVFRYYRCSDAGRWDHSQSKAVSDTGVRYDESIGMVSSALQDMMDSISQCTSDSAAYYPRNSSSYGHSNHSEGEREDEPNEYTPVFFYHHRHKLANMLNLVEGQAKIQLLALMNYIETTQGDRFRELDSSIAQGIIHSHNITMLFCPNDVVVSKPGGILKAQVLRAWPRIGGTGFMLECWHWAFNGGALSRKHITLDITKPLQAVVQIRDLEVFPARFAIAEELRHLESRGAKFWSLRYQSFVAYAGWDSKGDQFYTNESRWMVDYRTYRQMHPTAENFVFQDVAKVPLDRWPETIPHTLETLESNCSLVLPPEIHAFSFNKKEWSLLLVDNIRPVKWNTDAFERLVLPAKTKDLVKSLVMVRASPRESNKRKLLDMMRDDIIAGKGNGLIMLLHGPPGTGKTLTAESVAEIAQMPLYSVTCGDIGTKPEVVEEYLETVLMLGKRWNCVLLLDEADVFLEERSLADLERNSLVSVFLRTLEYYNGILILTSNRVGTFDAAFTSRIQVALHYDPLTSASRRKIWQNFFDMLRTDEEDVDLDDLLGHFDELVRGYDMNGRQIRNAFTTARQLAIFKGETLTWGHLEQALQSVCKFNTYLQTLHGHTDDQWARDEKLR